MKFQDCGFRVVGVESFRLVVHYVAGSGFRAVRGCIWADCLWVAAVHNPPTHALTQQVFLHLYRMQLGPKVRLSKPI